MLIAPILKTTLWDKYKCPSHFTDVESEIYSPNPQLISDRAEIWTQVCLIPGLVCWTTTPMSHPTHITSLLSLLPTSPQLPSHCEILFKNTKLERRNGKLFCKRQNHNPFQFCRPYSLCHTIQLCQCSVKAGTHNKQINVHDCIPIKLY